MLRCTVVMYCNCDVTAVVVQLVKNCFLQPMADSLAVKQLVGQSCSLPVMTVMH